MSEETIVWISGATEGIGLGLARTVPYENARIINLSRRKHPDYESVQFDLAKPETWDAVGDHFKTELDKFKGRRAIFIQNAFLTGTAGYAGTVDKDLYRRGLFANAMAPLVLADFFLRAVRPEFESGLVLISSNTARWPVLGHSSYCAAKAGIEHWVRVVRRERQKSGIGPWVVAVRPGFVDTQTSRLEATYDPEIYPEAASVKRGLQNGYAFDPETAGRNIWEKLPPPPDDSVLVLGQPPSE